jgi:uncharacterized protein YbdZ (MbtH family)
MMLQQKIVCFLNFHNYDARLRQTCMFQSNLELSRSGSKTPMNPFEDTDADLLILVNDKGEYCTWPSFRDVPAGWTVVANGDRAHCSRWIETNWKAAAR